MITRTIIGTAMALGALVAAVLAYRYWQQQKDATK